MPRAFMSRPVILRHAVCSGVTPFMSRRHVLCSHDTSCPVMAFHVHSRHVVYSDVMPVMSRQHMPCTDMSRVSRHVVMLRAVTSRLS